MRKTLNLQASAMTDEAKAFMLAGGADSLILWAPQHGKPETAWQVLDANVKWAHGILKTFIAVPSAGVTVTQYPDYLRSILTRYPHTAPIVQNEPDYAGVPAWTCAQLMMTAADLAAETGHDFILGPGTATAMYAMMVLSHLRNWTPAVNVGYAHHQYIDVGRGTTWCARTVLAAMNAANWQDGQNLWLTEGGYIFKTTGTPGAAFPVDPGNWRYQQPLAQQELHQLDNTLKHYRWAQDSGNVAMWAGYEYQDSLWGGWASGLVAHDGARHPLHDVWLAL